MLIFQQCDWDDRDNPRDGGAKGDRSPASVNWEVDSDDAMDIASGSIVVHNK